MTRIALLTISLIALGGRMAPAQAPPAKDPVKPDISRQILGVWEGPYQSESVPPGSLKLTVARDQGTWKVVLEVISDQPPPAGEVRNFTLEGNTISWAQDIADMECKSTATLVAGILKGTAECTQAGAVAVTASFLLEKKS